MGRRARPCPQEQGGCWLPVLFLLPCPLAAPLLAARFQCLLLKFLEGGFPTLSPPSVAFGEDFSNKHLQSYFLQTPLLLRCQQMQGTAWGQGAIVANRGSLCSHQRPGVLRSTVQQPCQALVPAEE